MPFSKVQKTLQKPFKINESGKVETVGDHLRLKRLQLGLFQKDVAGIFGVSEDTITFWEKERSEPKVQHYPKIIQFLGYYPFSTDESISGLIKQYRHFHGLTKKRLAMFLKVDPGTLSSWESGKTKPFPKVAEQLKRKLKNP